MSGGHERWADAAGAYLLEAMEAGERSDFEAHLETCATCRQEIADLRPAAEALPVSATPVPPPSELRARIMATVEREASLLRAAGPAADRAPAAERRRWRLRPGLLRPALVAGALLVGVLGGVALDATLRDGGAQATPITVDREQAPRASGELQVEDGEARLVVSDLPAPPAGRVYQVWVQPEGGTPRPTDALFLPRGDGSAVAAVPGGMDGVDAVLVTHEPGGGSTAPTRTPLLSVSPS